MADCLRRSRLCTRDDFKRVFDQRKKITYKYLRAFVRSNELTYSRLGLIISKSVIKKAVERNVIRRIIRESFRKHQAQLKGNDIIVMMHDDIYNYVDTNLHLRDHMVSAHASDAKKNRRGVMRDIKKHVHTGIRKTHEERKILRHDIDQLWKLIIK